MMTRSKNTLTILRCSAALRVLRSPPGIFKLPDNPKGCEAPPKNKKFQHNLRFAPKDYLLEILNVLKSGVSWNSYSGKIKGNTLNKKHIEWVNVGVYEHFYKTILNKHLNKVPKTKEFKYLSVDSSFIIDKNGSSASGYNSYYGKKKNGIGIKVSTITTSSGLPIATSVDPGNDHDCGLFDNVIEKIVVDTKALEYVNNNRFKQYILADKAYDSTKVRNTVLKKGFTPIIPKNKRNTKNIMRPSLNRKERTIIKKRRIVENYFSWMKKYRRIEYLYERNIENYEGFLFLAMSFIILRKTNLLQKHNPP